MVSVAALSTILQMGNLPMFEILKYPNPKLNIICKPVTEFGTHLIDTVNSMIATMVANNGIGLAANQVGLDIRLFVMNVQDSMKEYINPVILEYSDEIEYDEGCLSFPGLFIDIRRYNKIKIKATTLMGVEFEEELEGLDAICFAHELDHLNGLTFFDHLSPLKQKMQQKKLQKLKREANR